MQIPLPSLTFFSQAPFHLGFFPAGVEGLSAADALGSGFGFLGMVWEALACALADQHRGSAWVLALGQ